MLRSCSIIMRANNLFILIHLKLTPSVIDLDKNFQLKPYEAHSNIKKVRVNSVIAISLDVRMLYFLTNEKNSK
jgi:hypothetical protein